MKIVMVWVEGRLGEIGIQDSEKIVIVVVVVGVYIGSMWFVWLLVVVRCSWFLTLVVVSLVVVVACLASHRWIYNSCLCKCNIESILNVVQKNVRNVKRKVIETI